MLSLVDAGAVDIVSLFLAEVGTIDTGDLCCCSWPLKLVNKEVAGGATHGGWWSVVCYRMN